MKYERGIGCLKEISRNKNVFHKTLLRKFVFYLLLLQQKRMQKLPIKIDYIYQS